MAEKLITTPQSPAPLVENIQALRGIAALLVIWTHLKFPVDALCPAKTNAFFASTFGSIGVDLFFIISGYVISTTAAKRHHHPLDFFLARLARVSPLYLIITIVAMLPTLTLPRFTLFYKNLGFNSVWNGLFYLPFFDRTGYTLPPLNIGWTLSFEMTFYIVFALLLNLFTPKRTALVLPLFFAVGALLAMFYQGPFFLLRFVFHPFVLNFSFGCVIYQLQHRIHRAQAWVLLAAAVSYFIVFPHNSDDLSHLRGVLDGNFEMAWLRVVYWGIPCALLVASFVGLERNGICVLPAVLVWLGEISYSLYLIHQFSAWQLTRVGLHLGIGGPVSITVGMFGLSIFSAWLCYRFVERPLTRRAQALAKRAARPAAPTGQVA